MDVGKNAMVMEVEEGVIEGDVHYRLLAEGVSANRFFSGANVRVGEEVHHVAWLAVPHGPVQGWLPQAW